MTARRQITFLLGAFTCTLALAACRGPVDCDERAADTLVLRAYDVPPGLGPELKEVLWGVMCRGGGNTPCTGQVALSPTGQLLVAAPQSFHTGVEQLLASVRDPKSAPPPPTTVRLDYWVVLAQPAEKPAVPPGLSDLAPLLDSYAAAKGPVAYTLVDRLTVSSLSGSPAKVGGPRVHVAQQPSVVGDTIVTDVDIMLLRGGYSFESRLTLPFGKTLVLAQSGAGEDFVASVLGGKPATADNAMLLYVIRGEKVAP